LPGGKDDGGACGHGEPSTEWAIAPAAPLAQTRRGFTGDRALLAKDSLTGLTVAFDLDGTLVDTAPDLIGVLNFLLEEEGLAPVPLSSARHLVGGGARAMLEHGFAEAGEVLNPGHADSLFARYLDVYADQICLASKPFPGAVQTLDQLAAAGAILCVCTNKLTGLSKLLLGKLHLADRFKSIVGPDEAPARKPDAAHLWAAVDAAGGDRSRVVFVGDSATDANTGKAAGVPSIGVSFGYTETPARELGFTVVIDSFDEFEAALAKVSPPA
jgi:phosphoglycolate phosphatase